MGRAKSGTRDASGSRAIASMQVFGSLEGSRCGAAAPCVPPLGRSALAAGTHRQSAAVRAPRSVASRAVAGSARLASGAMGGVERSQTAALLRSRAVLSSRTCPELAEGVIRYGPGEGVMLCAPVTGATIAEQHRQAAEAKAEGADIVELRLDYLDKLETAEDLLELIVGCPLPAVVTYRPTWEG